MAVIKSYQGQFNCPNQFVKSTLYDILMDEPVGTVATVIYENVADAIRAYQNINDGGACESDEEELTRIVATTKNLECRTDQFQGIIPDRVFYHIKNQSNTMVEATLLTDTNNSDSYRTLRFRRVNPVSAINALSINDIFINEVNGDPLGLRRFKCYCTRASDVIKFINTQSKR